MQHSTQPSSRTVLSLDGMNGDHVRLGLPKGRFASIYEPVLRLASQTGSNLISPEGPKIIHLKDTTLRVFYLKVQDIPILLAKNSLELGIITSDWVAETQVELEQYGHAIPGYHTRISFIGLGLPKPSEVWNVITEYPKLTEHYLFERGISASITAIHGACEELVPYSFPVGVTCIETGGTLNMYDIRELRAIMNGELGIYGRKPLDLKIKTVAKDMLGILTNR